MKRTYLLFFLLLSTVFTMLPQVASDVEAQKEPESESELASVLPKNMISQTTMEPSREPYIFNPAQNPEMYFDGANYHFNTSYGVYTWLPWDNIMRFSFPNETNLIKESIFILQALDQYGDWEALEDFTEMVTLANISKEHGFGYYQVSYGIKKKKDIIGNVTITAIYEKPEVKTLPKISVLLSKNDDWYSLGLNHSRWIWDIVPSNKWKYWVDDANEGTVDITDGNTLEELGYFNKTYLSTMNDYSQISNFLQIDWTDTKVYAKTFGGKEPYFNSRGIVVVFPVDKDFIDPFVVVSDTGVNDATRYSVQLKTFRNPRGQKWYYAMFYNQSGGVDKLLFYKSKNQTYSELEATIHTFTATDYESSSLWIYDNSTLLIVYFVYTELDSGTAQLYYQRGTIADGETTISLEGEQTVATGVFWYPYISIADDGFIWITVTYQIGGSWTLKPRTWNTVLKEWSTNGSEPWIREIDYPANYTYVTSKDKWMEKWNSFDTGVTGNPTSATIDFYSQGDGGDYYVVWLWKSPIWTVGSSFTPDSSWSWKSLNVLTWASTASVVNSAQLKIEKKNSGSANQIDVDACKIEITATTDKKLVTYVSKVVYEPTSSNWSSQQTILSDGEDQDKPSKVLPLGTGSDVVIVWRYYDVPNTDGEVWVMPANWSGSSLTKGSTDDFEVNVVRTSERFDELGAVVDSNSILHISASKDVSPRYDIYNNWTEGVGFGSGYIVDGDYSRYNEMYMSIDLTSSPEKLYYFFRHEGGDRGIDYRVGTIGTSVSWSEPYDINMIDVEWARHRSSSYRDVGGQVQTVWTDQLYDTAVRWEQFPYNVTSFLNTGGTLYVNGTLTSNTTSNYFDAKTYANITAVADGGYQFDNHTATSDKYGVTVNFTATWIFRINTTNSIWTYFNVSVGIYAITFYFYAGGYLLVNSSQVANGSSANYNSGNILNLTGVKNKTGWQPIWQLKNFTSGQLNSSNNPSFYTVSAVDAIHTYFEGNRAFTLVFYTMVVFISCFIFLIFYLRRKR